MNNIISWETSLDRCPYCESELNIKSFSTRSEKSSIGNVITMSKIHLNVCRGEKQKQLADIRVKISSLEKSGKTSIEIRRDKILSY
jgi:hypothetical protein